MGSDIFTESAVAVELSNFLDVDTIKKKGVRELISNILYQEKYIDEKAFAAMVGSKNGFIDTLLTEISAGVFSGCESNEERNRVIIETFCLHGGIHLCDLPEWTLRKFNSCRESGYDIVTDTVYIMFECYDLFETVMTVEGRKVAETLGLDRINETTWTVHSY